MRAIDSSIVAKLATGEDGWERVADYLIDAVTLDLAIIELGNVLLKKVRRGEVGEAAASRIFASFRPVLQVADQNKYLDLALVLSIRHGIAFYDALFVAFASIEGYELVTCDEHQAKIAEKLGVDTLLC